MWIAMADRRLFAGERAHVTELIQRWSELLAASPSLRRWTRQVFSHGGHVVPEGIAVAVFVLAVLPFLPLGDSPMDRGEEIYKGRGKGEKEDGENGKLREGRGYRRRRKIEEDERRERE
ncbi:hypothetical protein EYF80_014294 [Liparis tanakae]|uniref:Uncharacterized protein n=1 Tax=Liparis tanakae TaxID=230148 RepID=A0A4Z2IDU4_9TELE|nr:hypothetical protein EYF80_014294 [Liparis tanakae]